MPVILTADGWVRTAPRPTKRVDTTKSLLSPLAYFAVQQVPKRPNPKQLLITAPPEPKKRPKRYVSEPVKHEEVVVIEDDISTRSPSPRPRKYRRSYNREEIEREHEHRREHEYRHRDQEYRHREHRHRRDHSPPRVIYQQPYQPSRSYGRSQASTRSYNWYNATQPLNI